MTKKLQIRRVFGDGIPGVKKGLFYIAEKNGGVKWEAAGTLAGAIANYEADKRQNLSEGGAAVKTNE